MKTRKCVKCGKEYPRTPEFFHRHKRRSDGMVERCKVCMNKQKREYYEDNKEVLKEKMKDYYANNQEKIKEYRQTDKWKEIKRKSDKKYRENHQESISEYRAKYAVENREKILQNNKEYYQNNKERFVEYRKNNIERIRLNKRISDSKRRANKLNQTPDYANLDLIRMIYENCPDGYQVDHMIPLANGGLHWESNLCYLPAEINSSKGSKRIEEFGTQEFCQHVIYWQDILTS